MQPFEALGLLALVIGLIIWQWSLVLPDEGAKRLLDMWVNGTALTNIRVGLYKNNVTISASSVYGDFTLANFSGYAAATPSFGAAAAVGGQQTITDSSARTFTCNGGGTTNTIYGYIVYDSNTNKLLWAEAFASSQSMANNGDQISVTAALSLISQ